MPRGERLISVTAQGYDGPKISLFSLQSLFSSKKLKGQTQELDILSWELFELRKCEVFYLDVMSGFISFVDILVAHWKMN